MSLRLRRISRKNNMKIVFLVFVDSSFAGGEAIFQTDLPWWFRGNLKRFACCVFIWIPGHKVRGRKKTEKLKNNSITIWKSYQFLFEDEKKILNYKSPSLPCYLLRKKKKRKSWALSPRPTKTYFRPFPPRPPPSRTFVCFVFPCWSKSYGYESGRGRIW